MKSILERFFFCKTCSWYCGYCGPLASLFLYNLAFTGNSCTGNACWWRTRRTTAHAERHSLLHWWCPVRAQKIPCSGCRVFDWQRADTAGRASGSCTEKVCQVHRLVQATTSVLPVDWNLSVVCLHKYHAMRMSVCVSVMFIFQICHSVNQIVTSSFVWRAWTKLECSSALWSYHLSCQRQQQWKTYYEASTSAATQQKRLRTQSVASGWTQRWTCEKSDCCVFSICTVTVMRKPRSISTGLFSFQMVKQ